MHPSLKVWPPGECLREHEAITDLANSEDVARALGREDSKMSGPGQARALNWGEAPWWYRLRMWLLRTGPSTPPSLGGLLLQDLFHGRLPGGQSGSGYRKEALGQALRERAGLGF